MIDIDSMYVGGEWIKLGDDAQRLDIESPTDASIIGTIALASEKDVNSAVDAASEAFYSWSRTSPAERSSYLKALLDLVNDHADELAELVTAEMGAPAEVVMDDQINVPIMTIENMIEILDDFMFEESLENSLIVKEPVGVVAAITPWNYPLYQVVGKIIPAIAAGCTVILKPSEIAPLSTWRFIELMDEAGFPAGVINLVNGLGTVVGTAMVEHPKVDMVSLTGSTRAGSDVASRASRDIKRVALELGGKSPSVILPSADVETAVPASVEYCMGNTGQACDAWTRLIVPESLKTEVERLAVAKAEELEAGLGPVISKDQFDKIQGFIERAINDGARLLTGGPGQRKDKNVGYFPRATVFSDVTNDMEIARSEVFGPVLSIITYGRVEEAIAIANDTEYGLHAGVWAATTDEALEVARQIRAGQVDINGGGFNIQAPFGGFKKSGIGREFGPIGFEEFLEVKSIQRPVEA